MEDKKKIKVGISIGDMNGIGPEVILKTFKDKRCLLYTSPSPRDRTRSRMPSSA